MDVPSSWRIHLRLHLPPVDGWRSNSKERMTRPADFLGSSTILGLTLLVFSVGFPPLDDLTTISLPLHMLQHVLIALSGFFLGHALSQQKKFPVTQRATVQSTSFLVATILLIFWHLPPSWDLAVANPAVHAAEHISFLLIGILIGLVLTKVSDNSKIGILSVGLFGQLVYGILLVSNNRIYPFYGLQEQNSLGLTMLLVGPFYSTGVLILTARYRAWFSEDTSIWARPISETRRARIRWKPVLSLLISISLIVTLTSYYALALESVETAQRPSRDTATVYLLETPISWQFSPQNLTVVISINNTVSWVSKSVFYDTVTSNSGLFNSGPIQPGHTFTYTFTQPGVYDYRCIYHPWMTGSVTVLSGN
jgi:plastocyanin